MSFNLYVMVSIPEAKQENVYTSPIILGVFDSKESAQAAWKARSAEFKPIKAKTLHTYYEVLSTEADTIPESVYVWAAYHVYAYFEGDDPQLEFTPYNCGFFETFEQYQAKKDWLDSQPTHTWREICKDSDFVFYAANENIIEKCPLNRLVQIPVGLTDRNDL